MVDLPIPKVPLATTEQPQTRLATSVLERTRYDNPGLGPGLQALGQGLDDLSVSVAEQAGKADAAKAAKAVTRDENGNVQVATPSNNIILGRAGKAYQHAVEVGVQTGLASQVSQRMVEMRNEFRDSPEKFKEAAASYANEMRDKYGGALGADAYLRAEQTATQHYTSLVNEKAQRDIQTGLQGVTTQIDDLSNQMRAMARQGGVDTPDFKTSSDRLNAYYDQLGKNPLFGYSPEKIASEKRRADETFRAEAVVGEVDRNFNKKGRAEAQASLEASILNNPGLHLSDQERSKLYSWGMARLQYLTGEQKAQIDAFRQTVSETVDGIRSGKISDAAADKIIEHARSIGDDTGVLQIIGARENARWAAGISGLSPDKARAAAFGGFVRGVGPLSSDAIHNVIVGQESGWNPNAPTSVTGATGIGQIQPGTFAMYAKPGENIKNPADNLAVSKRIIADYYQKFNGDPARIAVAYFSGEGNVAPVGSATPWKQDRADPTGKTTSSYVADIAKRLGGQSGGASVNGVPFTKEQIKANPYLLSEWVHRIASDGQTQVQAAKSVGDAIETGLKGGLLPSATNLAMFQQIAAQHPQTFSEQSQRIVAQIQGSAVAAQAGEAPAGQGQALINAAMAQANGGSIFQQQVALAAKSHFEQNAKELVDNPGYSAAKRGWITRPPAPLDFSAPDRLAATMDDRNTMAEKISSHTGGLISALQPQDMDQVRSMMSNGTLDQKGAFIGSLSKLSEPVLRATLDKLGSDKMTAPLAIAANIAKENIEVTRGILAGMQEMQAEPKLSPKDDSRELAFSKALPVTSLPIQVRDAISQATAAYYAHLSAQQNDVSNVFKQARFDEALKAVTGGVLDHRGSKVIAPWYGATQEQMDAAIRAVSDADLQGARTTGGDPFPARMLKPSVGAFFTSNGYRLANAGSGKYNIVSGSPDKPVPVIGGDGRPFVLDLGAKKNEASVWQPAATRWDAQYVSSTNQFARSNMPPDEARSPFFSDMVTAVLDASNISAEQSVIIGQVGKDTGLGKEIMRKAEERKARKARDTVEKQTEGL